MAQEMNSELQTCHLCGQVHKMAMTPFPFIPAGNGRVFCPYDTEGEKTMVPWALFGRPVIETDADEALNKAMEVLFLHGDAVQRPVGFLPLDSASAAP